MLVIMMGFLLKTSENPLDQLIGPKMQRYQSPNAEQRGDGALIKSEGAFLTVYFCYTIENAVVDGVEKRLIGEANFDDFEGLHGKDLGPAREAAAEELNSMFVHVIIVLFMPL